MKNMKWLLVGLVPMAIAACSGGDLTVTQPIDPNIAGTDIPTSATTTGIGASIFVKQIVLAGDKDADEALVDGNAMLAVSETDEPDSSI